MRPLVMKIMKKLDEDPVECDDEDPAERDDEKRREWPGLWNCGNQLLISAANASALPESHHILRFESSSELIPVLRAVIFYNDLSTCALLALLFAGQWSLKRISTYTLLKNIFIIIMRTFHSECKYELSEVIRVRLNPFPIPRNSKTDFGFCAFKLILIFREPL